MPSLADLRSAEPQARAPSTMTEIVADLHMRPVNAGAVFQVASQFNLLEMTGPSITPEDGVARYESDPTQGPACAIACGAGTIYRNYFHPVGGGIGQSADRQIDCLEEVGRALDNPTRRFWTLRNGYALAASPALADLNGILERLSERELRALEGRLKVGVQTDVEVTLGRAGHGVTQVFCSAMPIAYDAGAPEAWEGVARLVLRAAYEATLRVAAQRPGGKVVLTLLGAGAFGNRGEWIVEAMLRAADLTRWSGLQIHVVSHGRPSPLVADAIRRFERG